MPDGELADRSRRPHRARSGRSRRSRRAFCGARCASCLGGAQDRALSGRAGLAPPASTVHAILLRHGRIVAPAGGRSRPQRFEKQAPNLLWQMDFKGWVRLADGAVPSADGDRRSFALCAVPGACADERRHGAERLKRPSAAMACRTRSSSTMARPGAIRRATAGRGSACGCSSSASIVGTPALPSAEPRQERALPPHPEGRSVRACDALRDLAEAQRAFDRLAASTTTSGRTRRSAWRCRPAATGRAWRDARPAAGPRLRHPRDRSPCPRPQGYISFKGRPWKMPRAFPRRTRCDPSTDHRRRLRNLLRLAPDRRHRSSRAKHC